MLTSRIRARVCGSGLRGRGIAAVVVVVVAVAAGKGEWLSRGGGGGGEGRVCGRGGKRGGIFFGGGCPKLMVCWIFELLLLLLPWSWVDDDLEIGMSGRGFGRRVVYCSF